MGKTVLNGTDLILSVGGKALGFSTGCKISTSTETGERVTKEATSGKWKEKYVKNFSESISAEGCVLTDGDADTPTYDKLKALQLAGEPVDAHYSLRDGDQRTGKVSGGYKGKYIITSLELDGQAGEDAKYSIQLENTGKVESVSSNGLSLRPEYDSSQNGPSYSAPSGGDSSDSGSTGSDSSDSDSSDSGSGGGSGTPGGGSGGGSSVVE